MLSFLLIAMDRYRYMADPTKPRMPSFVCSLGTWLLAVCIVLPYPIYITYLDLGVSVGVLCASGYRYKQHVITECQTELPAVSCSGKEKRLIRSCDEIMMPFSSYPSSSAL
jgi:hypothetical protein